MLFCQELRVEEDQGVDDLLGVEDDVEGGGEVGLVPGLGQLLHLQHVGGGGEVTRRDC